MRLGRYTLGKRLAVGGMAEIFLAEETGLAGFRRRVVVKRILPQHAQNEEFAQLFLDEARLAAQLSHPNIVHIYELGWDEDAGTYYIAMEHVPGCDLGTLLSAMGGPLPISDSLHIVSHVLEGLHFAHTLCDAAGEPLGVVHRDICPGNVLISIAGAVKIVDFGIAKARTKVSVTVPGRVMGTVGYMSPEQARGDPVDRRSDIFAAGALLYRMTTGTEALPLRAAIAFAASGMAVRPPREARPDIPEDVERIILTAMARAKDERYSTAAEMRRDVTTAALRSGLAPDPELLAGLVRTFAPTDEEVTDEDLEPPGERALGGEPAPERPGTPSGLAAMPASAEQDEGEIAGSAPHSVEIEVEEPSGPWDRPEGKVGLDLPLTREGPLAIDEEASIDIDDSPLHDTLADQSLEVLLRRTAPATPALVEDASSEEPTLGDEPRSVEVAFDEDGARITWKGTPVKNPWDDPESSGQEGSK